MFQTTKNFSPTQMDNYEGAHKILNGNTQKSFFWTDIKMNNIVVQNDEMQNALISVDIRKSGNASFRHEHEAWLP